MKALIATPIVVLAAAWPVDVLLAGATVVVASLALYCLLGRR